MRGWLVALAAATLVSGCSAKADIGAAEDSIAQFHHDLDSGRFADIYSAAGPELKNSSTQADMVALLSAVHRKLGPFKSGKSVGWNVNYATGGHYVTLTYTADYQRGPAQEQFVYRIAGSNAVLAGYHINSTQLIVN